MISKDKIIQELESEIDSLREEIDLSAEISTAVLDTLKNSPIVATDSED